MSHLGLGVILKLLGGNETSAKMLQKNIGKTITALEITEKELLFTFADGSKMKLLDDGQSCCERRYMHTDDNIQDFIGATLQGAETREGGKVESKYRNDVKESEFLIVSTSRGQFTVVNYNEHNGYYGGFCIRAMAV